MMCCCVRRRLSGTGREALYAMSSIVLSQWKSRTCCMSKWSSIICSSQSISSGVASRYLSSRSVSSFKIDCASQLVRNVGFLRDGFFFALFYPVVCGLGVCNTLCFLGCFIWVILFVDRLGGLFILFCSLCFSWVFLTCDFAM